MRWNDLNDGSIKALLLGVLIAANIAAALLPGSARVSRAGDGVPAVANFSRKAESPEKFVSAERRKPARETRALPGR